MLACYHEQPLIPLHHRRIGKQSRKRRRNDASKSESRSSSAGSVSFRAFACGSACRNSMLALRSHKVPQISMCQTKRSAILGRFISRVFTVF